MFKDIRSLETKLKWNNKFTKQDEITALNIIHEQNKEIINLKLKYQELIIEIIENILPKYLNDNEEKRLEINSIISKTAKNIMNK